MKQGILIFTSLILASLVPANAATTRVSGIYSDMYYNEEGGDLLGMELMIVPTNTNGGYSAFVQFAEGGAPTVAIVSLDIDGTKIEFTIPKEIAIYGGDHFVGVVKGDGIVGHWSNGQPAFTGGKEEHLKRGKSYWQ